MILFPNSKINLGLIMLRKRPDGFHDLQTFFYPIAIKDALEIISNPSLTNEDVQFTSTGLPISGDTESNLCVKAYRLLKQDFPQLPAVQLHLHKVIPMGAGLGGGSADGAFTLTLLNKKFNLGLTEVSLIEYALKLGSDCPFFIKNKPCLAEGRGEMLKPVALNLSSYKLVVVHPGIHINTGWAFSNITPVGKHPNLKDVIQLPVSEWKDVLTNDFESAVFAHYPEIAIVKQSLYNIGALYASLSGSGSAVYGIFEDDREPQLSFPSHYFVRTVAGAAS